MRALNRPTSWWGWHWEPPTPMSVAELIAAGNLSVQVAALFWVAMERGASLIVAADPPNSGKTTTLSALLSFTRPETLVYFTRGVGEPFDLPALSPDYDTYVLVNEMSDHIPVYTWDENARRTFELLSEGYRLGTTMHADTTAGVLSQLEGDLRVPKHQVAGLTFIMPLYIGRSERGIMRRVLEAAFLQPNGDGYKVLRAVEWVPERDAFRLFPESGSREAMAAWAKLTPPQLDSEIGQREAFIEKMIQTGATSIPEVNTAIEEYYERVVRGAHRSSGRTEG